MTTPLDAIKARLNDTETDYPNTNRADLERVIKAYEILEDQLEYCKFRTQEQLDLHENYQSAAKAQTKTITHIRLENLIESIGEAKFDAHKALAGGES